ncbi:YdeI/OmpD-associated family protein [Leucobacter sp. USCH14]|uniref:YdeI/OmpD-associated family protein n=1 Tax=Leucobacter sp. USCH14 TaxID=3024838 RepID=UPI00309BA418
MSRSDAGVEPGAPTFAEPAVFADAAAWRAWLEVHEDAHDGGWVVLAKKGTTSPTSLSYQDALEVALCSGWIDGQKQSRDGATFQQRFTPRRARSMWSKRNVDIIARLDAEGLLRPRGRAEVERAQADGRWERAYAGSATMDEPEALVAALAADPVARSAFDALSRSARYSALHPIVTAVRPETRARRIAALVERLREA